MHFDWEDALANMSDAGSVGGDDISAAAWQHSLDVMGPSPIPAYQSSPAVGGDDDALEDGAQMVRGEGLGDDTGGEDPSASGLDEVGSEMAVAPWHPPIAPDIEPAGRPFDFEAVSAVSTFSRTITDSMLDHSSLTAASC